VGAVFANLRPRPRAADTTNNQAPPAAPLAADQLVGGVDGHEASPGAIECPTSVARALVRRHAKRLKRGLTEPNRALLAAVQRPLRPSCPCLERHPNACAETGTKRTQKVEVEPGAAPSNDLLRRPVTVYAWAAEQILARRLPEERPSDAADYAAAVHHEHQTLRHNAHHKLMQAFLEPEIFDGAVTITRTPATPGNRQLRLVDNEHR